MYNNLTNFQALILIIAHSGNNTENEFYKDLIFYGFPYNGFNREKLLNKINSIHEFQNTTLTLDFVKNLKDPARNYFETTLSYHNLKILLADNSFLEKLELLFKKFEEFKVKLQTEAPKGFDTQMENFKHKKEEKSKTFAHILDKFSTLEKEIINKMLDFVWFSLEYDKSLDFLCREIMNCYGKEKFSNAFRGKEGKIPLTKQSESHFNSNKTGLMRSKDPSPLYDDIVLGITNTEGKQNEKYYVSNRCPDVSYPTFESKNFPTEIAESGVNIFSNSISGTTLAILRLYTAILTKDCLISDKNFQTFKKQTAYPMLNDFIKDFKSNLFFINFFRFFSSTLLYLEGGHSMFEFYKVLEIEKVSKFIEELVTDISAIDIKELYFDSYTLHKALSLTIDYTVTILNKERMLNELKQNHTFNIKRQENLTISNNIFNNYLKYRLTKNKIYTIEKFIEQSYKTNLFETKLLQQELNNVLKLLILYNSINVYNADQKFKVLKEIKESLSSIGDKIFSNNSRILFKKNKIKMSSKFIPILVELLYSVYSEENLINKTLFEATNYYDNN